MSANLNECLTIPEAAQLYGVTPSKVSYRISSLQKNAELKEQLTTSGMLKFSGGVWLLTTELMDIWFVKKEKKPSVFPKKVREYVSSLSDLEELTELKRLIEQRELEFKSSNDFIAKFALNLKVPYHVMLEFIQLAQVIDIPLYDLKIRNWKNKRLYYRDPRRSKSAHREGYFYYCLKDEKFINPFLKEEESFK